MTHDVVTAEFIYSGLFFRLIVRNIMENIIIIVKFISYDLNLVIFSMNSSINIHEIIIIINLQNL